MEILTVLLTVIYVFCCLFLGFVVLIQKGEGGGLGGAFGGGAVDVAFGAKADMTWKRATAASATLFMVLAIVIGILEDQLHHGSSIAEKAAEQKGADEGADKDKDADKDADEATDPLNNPGMSPDDSEEGKLEVPDAPPGEGDGGSSDAPPADGGGESPGEAPPADDGQ